MDELKIYDHALSQEELKQEIDFSFNISFLTNTRQPSTSYSTMSSSGFYKLSDSLVNYWSFTGEFRDNISGDVLDCEWNAYLSKFYFYCIISVNDISFLISI